MKVEYDKPADVLTLTVRDAEVTKSKEVRFGIIVDADAKNQILRYKIRNASEHIVNLNQCANNPQAIIKQALDHIAAAVSYNGAQPIP